MNDEHGMPLPHEESPLPWVHQYTDRILASDEAEVAFCDCLGEPDADFIVHAVNNIVECRDIVRRLAEQCGPYGRMFANQLQITMDAAKLWAKMQKGVSDE